MAFRFLEKYGVRGTRSSAILPLLIIWGLSALVSACAIAPGTEIPSSIKRDSAVRSDAAQPPVALIEINASMLAVQARQALGKSVQLANELTSSPSVYTVGPADVLQITVWDHPELAQALGPQSATAPRPADPTQGVLVDADGSIQFPYVGRLDVAGLGTSAIQERLRKALSQYFRAPQVTVRIASFRSKQVFIDGEVHAPGAQQINDVPMTLTEAISRAGGFTAAADQGRLLLIRNGQSYSIDLPGMVKHGVNPAGVVLQRNDVLRVMSRDQSGVFVMGEVSKQMTAVPKQDGTLSLADALSQAGSFNLSTSNPQQLYVIRGAQDSHPEVFHLDAKSPVSMMMATRFQLQPEDVVYVDATDLVRVNRVLSLLIPAIDAGLAGALVAK